MAQLQRRPVLSPRAPRGFSLIEVLVVVGILSLLTAIAVIGFRVVGGASKNRATAVALENCNGLLNEYKHVDPTAAGLLDTALVDTITGAPGPLRWVHSVNGQPNDIVNASASTPGVVPTTGLPESDLHVRAVRERYLRDETARVMKRLMSVPANRAAIESMPPDRLIKVKYPVASALPVAPQNDPPEYALPDNQMVEGVILADGSGHPIYFIPGGGLLYVNVGYNGTGAAGTADRADKANYDTQTSVRAPDHGPFWASGGPDGDLTTGDDNQYSFGQ